MERSENQRKLVMNRYADCIYCGGEVVEESIDYDYRREKRLMVLATFRRVFAVNAARNILSPMF